MSKDKLNYVARLGPNYRKSVTLLLFFLPTPVVSRFMPLTAVNKYLCHKLEDKK